MMIEGYEISINWNLVEYYDEPVVKNWIDNVIEWNPCNVEFIKPDFIKKSRPSKKVFIVGNRMICHPVVADQIRKEYG